VACGAGLRLLSGADCNQGLSPCSLAGPPAGSECAAAAAANGADALTKNQKKKLKKKLRKVPDAPTPAAHAADGAAGSGDALGCR